MSLSKPDTPFQIVPDLLHDARINYKPWLACIFAIAASQCQTQFDSGCLFMVMTDAEYAAFPLHVDAGGQAIQRPTVVPPVLPPIDANGMLRDGFNRALAHHEAWVTVRAKLLAAVIKSVLPQDLMALRDPQHAFLLLTLPNLLAHIKTVHGTVTAIDLSAMKAALLQKLASPADFRNHAALFADRAAAIHLEEPIAPTALFAIFKETFAHHPSFLPSMGRFFETTPLRANHTVPNLIAHLTPSLDFIIELSSPSAAFGLLGLSEPPKAAPVVPPAPPSKSTRPGKTKKGKQEKQRDALLAYMAEQGIAIPPHLAAGALTHTPSSSQSSSSTSYVGPRTSLTAPTPAHLYCFVRGWTTRHGWKKRKWEGEFCRVLSSPSSGYTQDQVNAQDPTTGGNANVYVVRPRPSLLPNRVSPSLMCPPCFLPSSPSARALPQKNKKSTKKFPLPSILSLPTFLPPNPPLSQWSP